MTGTTTHNGSGGQTTVRCKCLTGGAAQQGSDEGQPRNRHTANNKMSKKMSKKLNKEQTESTEIVLDVMSS